MGDYNAGLPAHPEPNWNRIPQHLHSRYRIMLPDGSYGPADRRGTGNLLSAGYVDPATHLRTLVDPTTGHWYSSEPEPQQLDHILVGAALSPSIRAYEVVNTSQTRAASDHLPLVMDLTVV